MNSSLHILALQVVGEEKSGSSIGSGKSRKGRSSQGRAQGPPNKGLGRLASPKRLGSPKKDSHTQFPEILDMPVEQDERRRMPSSGDGLSGWYPPAMPGVGVARESPIGRLIAGFVERASDERRKTSGRVLKKGVRKESSTGRVRASELPQIVHVQSQSV